MRRLLTIISAVLTFTVAADAMSYEQARDQALFLTDKMAYELNLTEEQYDAAYEINLDYLMSVNTPDDLYEAYWRQRNLDLSYILLDWQYQAFCAATYFYRPLYWASGVWHFAIYSRYPRRHHLYFGRPNIYITYRGGHSWHHNGGHSWYKGRTFNHGKGGEWHGMRDRFDRGDFHRGDRPKIGNNNNNNRRPGNNLNNRFSGNRNNKNDNRRPSTPQNDKNNIKRPTANPKVNSNVYRQKRESSTRTTARQGLTREVGQSSGSKRNTTTKTLRSKPSNTFRPKTSGARPTVKRNVSASRLSGARNAKQNK